VNRPGAPRGFGEIICQPLTISRRIQIPFTIKQKRVKPPPSSLGGGIFLPPAPAPPGSILYSLPPLFDLALLFLRLYPLLFRRLRRLRSDPPLLLLQSLPDQRRHLFDDLLLIRQLAAMHLRLYLYQPIRIDLPGELFFQEVLLLVRKDGRSPDGEISLHHGFYLIHILSALTPAAGRLEKNFFGDIDLHITLTPRVVITGRY